MAAIPLYHQEKLASSRVGVPDMPRGGEIMAESVLNGAHQLAQTALGAQHTAIATQIGLADQAVSQSLGNLREVRAIEQYRQAQVDAQTKEQTRLLHETNISNYAHLYKMNADKAVGEIYNNQSIPPEQRAEIVKNRLESMQRGYAEQFITDPTEAAGFTKAVNPHIESAYNKAINDENTFKTTQAFGIYNSTKSQSIANTKTVDDFKNLETYLNDPAQIRSREFMHGKGAEAELRDYKTKAAINSIYHYINTGEAQKAEDLVRSDAYGTLFDEKAKGDLVDAAKKQVSDDIKMNEVVDKSLAQTDKSKINDIYGAAITRPDSVGYEADIRKIDAVVKAEQKKPETGPGHRNEQVITFGLERMEQLRKRKTDTQLANAAGRSALAAEHANENWQRAEDRRKQEAKIAEAPNQKALSAAQTSFKTAIDMTKKESKTDLQTKLSLLDDAFSKNNAAHDAGIMHDKEWQDRDSSIRARMNELQGKLKPASHDFWDIGKSKEQLATDRYTDLLATGASPLVLKTRNIGGDKAKVLAANAEHAYWLRRAVSTFQSKNPGQKPDVDQINQIEKVIEMQMVTNH